MITTRGLTAVRGRFTLGPVDLSVPAGAYLALLGPSGHGKTTLLAALAGLIPSTGSIDLGGVDLAALPAHRRGVGLVPQGGLLFPHLTVAANLTYGRELPRPALEALATTWGCTELLSRSVAALSGGETMRVALARALAVEPRLLLLDEPLASLDGPGRTELQARLRELQGTRAVVHVTHNVDEAAAVSTHLAVLIRGQLQAFGPTAEILERPPTPEVAALLSTPPSRVLT